VGKKRGTGYPIQPTFADLVRELPMRVTSGFRTIPTLVGRKKFTDEDGITWSRRGEDVLQGKALEKHLRDPAVRVLHEYAGELHAVPPTGREAFWKQAQELMGESEHSDFYGVQFKDEQGNHLLVVHEDC
jgi:hypothetical protein